MSQSIMILFQEIKLFQKGMKKKLKLKIFNLGWDFMLICWIEFGSSLSFWWFVLHFVPPLYCLGHIKFHIFIYKSGKMWSYCPKVLRFSISTLITVWTFVIRLVTKLYSFVKILINKNHSLFWIKWVLNQNFWSELLIGQVYPQVTR